jgi:hypothetical protein
VDDIRRAEPAIDARNVTARPRGQQAARRPRDEARIRWRVGAHQSGARAERVGHERRRRFEITESCDDLGDGIPDTTARTQERSHIDRDSGM